MVAPREEIMDFPCLRRVCVLQAAAMTDMLMCLTESRDGWKEEHEEGEEEEWMRGRRFEKRC